MKMPTALGRLKSRMESGAGAVTFQVIGYIYVLTGVLVMVFDFGSLAMQQQIASSAVVIAAQDLAKSVDTDSFILDQEIQLGGTAGAGAAQTVVNRVLSGNGSPGNVVLVTSAAVETRDHRDVVVVKAQTTAPLPALHTLFGIEPVTINVEGVAEASFGIEAQDQ